MKKKKILFHSNHSKAKTGFGKHMKHLITYLYKTNKYDLNIEKGGAIVFDESGIHRGSATRFSSRLALRFFFKKI